MVAQVCHACGQTLPALDPIDAVKMSAGDRRIYALVHHAGQHGISCDRLFDLLYADDPDGGPLTGKSSLHTRIYLLNFRLRSIGKEIRAGKGIGNGIYRLIDTKRIKRRGERVLKPATVDKLRAEYFTARNAGRNVGHGRRVTQEQLGKKYGITQAHVSTLVRYRDRANAPYWKPNGGTNAQTTAK